MNIERLKQIVNSIPDSLNHLNVWIDTDESEGGRPVEVVELKYAEDCCLDLDEGSETVYEDELLELLGIDEVPEPNSFEFTQVIMKMNELNYRYEGSQSGEHVFSKQILTIKF